MEDCKKRIMAAYVRGYKTADCYSLNVEEAIDVEASGAGVDYPILYTYADFHTWPVSWGSNFDPSKITPNLTRMTTQFQLMDHCRQQLADGASSCSPRLDEESVRQLRKEGNWVFPSKGYPYATHVFENRPTIREHLILLSWQVFRY